MQDKEQINTDFIDTAWTDMASRLDDHMPVTPNRKKRILYWWWAIAAALLLLLSIPAYWSLQDRPDQHATSGLTPAPPSADKSINDPSNTAASATSSAETLPAQTDLSSEPQNALATDFTSLPTSTAKASSPQLSSLPVSKSSVTDTPSAPMELGPSSKIDRSVASEKPASSSVDTKTPTPSPVRVLHPETTIQTLEPAALTVAKSTMPSLQPIRAKQPATWFTEANGYLNPSRLISGFSFGIARQDRWIGKLYWSAGLAYRFTRWHLANQNQEDNFANALSVEGFLTTNQAAVGQGVVIKPSLVKEHAIELPLRLSYSAGPRWQFDAGIHASYSFGVYAGDIAVTVEAADILTEDIQDSYRAVAESSRRWYRGSSGSRVLPTYINTFRADASLGVHYRISPRWGVQAQGRYSLSPTIKRESADLAKISAGLGLRYYLR